MRTTLNFFLWISFFAVLTFTTSCKKNDDGPDPEPGVSGNNSNLTVKADNAITKKWVIDHTPKLAAGAADYSWFEFSPYGIFVIGKSDGSILEGTYTYDEANNEIVLEGVGVISITTVSSTEFDFTFTPDGESAISFLGNSGTAVDEGSKTLQMARGWKLVSQTTNGADTGINSLVDSAYVLITKYGTHMVVLKNFMGTGDMHIPQVWKWNDQTTQASICVGDVVPDCTSPITITLTSDNKMIAEYTDEDGTTREEYVEMVIP